MHKEEQKEGQKVSHVIRDMMRIVAASGFVILMLVGVLLFSPLASQHFDDSVSRGGESVWEIDSTIAKKDYQRALVLTDSLIAEERKDLPRWAFFDRYLSEDERYEATLSRANIYQLQWKRIEILKTMNEVEKLRCALKDYCRVIGYNQEEAKTLLNQIEGK